jgi:membrane protein DedA with SNARE-associated domain
MDALIAQAADVIRDNSQWAGVIICLLTFGESMFIIGVLIPATALLLMTGGLMGSGTLPWLPILLWGYAGAILGDAVSYLIGKWMGPRVLRCKPLQKHRRNVAKARLLFYRYGFAAVLIGRFLGPLRSTIPTVAGVMGMSSLRFQIANVLSALFWIPGLLAPGYLAALSTQYTNLTQAQTLYSVIGLTVMIGLGATIVIARRRPNTKRKHSQ